MTDDQALPGRRYLVAIHHPDDYDPSVEDEAMTRDIDALNDEMVAAGVRLFVGGLHAPGRAKSLRPWPGGKVLVTDGPYLETKEHVGGLAPPRQRLVRVGYLQHPEAAVACRAPVEIRPFHG